MRKNKKVLVDMTCSIIHHGHIRLLKKASKYGKVIVALTSDEEIVKYKKFKSPLNFQQRKEILSSIKYVYKVLKSKWAITTDYLRKNKIDIFVRGSDYRNQKIFQNTIFHQRTKGISSSLIRKKILSRRKN